MSQPNPNNTLFVTVAAWESAAGIAPKKFWQTREFVYSADVFGVNVHWIDYGRPWQGFYTHKILRLNELLRTYKIRYDYVVYVDARDGLFLAPPSTICERLARFPANKVVFASCRTKRTWPYAAGWFEQRIKDQFGEYGILNAGTFAGRTDAMIDMLEECISIHDRFVNHTPLPFDQEGLEKRVFLQTGETIAADDQFLFQFLQAKGSDRIIIDTEKELFACFGERWPNPSDRQPPHLPWSLGEAVIIHSPWLSHETVRWNQWSRTIVDARSRFSAPASTIAVHS